MNCCPVASWNQLCSCGHHASSCLGGMHGVLQGSRLPSRQVGQKDAGAAAQALLRQRCWQRKQAQQHGAVRQLGCAVGVQQQLLQRSMAGGAQ